MALRVDASARASAPLVAVLLTGGVFGAAGPTGDDVVDRAREFWTAFEAELGSVLADEDYRQEARWPQAPKVGGTVVRQLQSEMLLFRVPESVEWVAFRDVLSVDGVPPSDRAPSIIETLADTSTPLDARVGRLVHASARYNLGDFVRTINTPTFAPIVLRPAHARRFRFTRERDAVVDDVVTAVVRFDETGRPTIVRGHGERNAPMRGRLWLSPSTGEVIRSSLDMADRRSGLTAKIEVEYALDANLGLRVPKVMRERYERRGHTVTTEASYRNYRRFTTSVRVIGHIDGEEPDSYFIGTRALSSSNQLSRMLNIFAAVSGLAARTITNRWPSAVTSKSPVPQFK
jgi:hypothetical protein